MLRVNLGDAIDLVTGNGTYRKGDSIFNLPEDAMNPQKAKKLERYSERYHLVEWQQREHYSKQFSISAGEEMKIPHMIPTNIALSMGAAFSSEEEKDAGKGIFVATAELITHVHTLTDINRRSIKEEIWPLLSDKNLSDFVMQNGTGYIDGLMYGNAIFIYITYKYISEKSSRSIKAFLNAAWNSNNITAELRSQFEKAREESSLTIDIRTLGVDDSVKEDIIKSFKDFSELRPLVARALKKDEPAKAPTTSAEALYFSRGHYADVIKGSSAEAKNLSNLRQHVTRVEELLQSIENKRIFDRIRKLRLTLSKISSCVHLEEQLKKDTRVEAILETIAQLEHDVETLKRYLINDDYNLTQTLRILNFSIPKDEDLNIREDNISDKLLEFIRIKSSDLDNIETYLNDLIDKLEITICRSPILDPRKGFVHYRTKPFILYSRSGSIQIKIEGNDKSDPHKEKKEYESIKFNLKKVGKLRSIIEEIYPCTSVEYMGIDPSRKYRIQFRSVQKAKKLQADGNKIVIIMLGEEALIHLDKAQEVRLHSIPKIPNFSPHRRRSSTSEIADSLGFSPEQARPGPIADSSPPKDTVPAAAPAPSTASSADDRPAEHASVRLGAHK